jgi:beta-lactamase regulating signal transducer with metallopeptidase domain
MIPLDPEVVHRLGWALVHFVWQGAALAALAAVMLRGLRRRTAAVRYLAACAALAAMVAVPAATLSLVPPAPTVAQRATGAEIPRSETPAAVVWTSLPADAPAAPASSRSASWAARIAPAIESALPQTVLAWLIGALAVSAWYAGGWIWVRRLIWKRAQPAAERWRQAVADLARRMRVSRPVRILESAAVRVPTLVGCLRPVILLPTSVLTGLAPEQIEALLAHELAHVRRWDYLVNLLQTLAEALLFYHPAVWWLSRRLRVEREQCCDDVVVATCGDRVAYARALATLGESSAVPAAALAAGDGRLLARIRRILVMEDERRTSTGRLVGSVALAGIALAAVAVLTAACGLCAAGWAGAAHPSGEATRSTATGGGEIRFVTPGGDPIKFVTPSGEEMRMLGVATPAPDVMTRVPLLRALGFLAAAGGKHILIEARFIQVPAEEKENMEAGLAGVGPGALPGSALLSREQADAFLARVAATKSVHTLAAPKVLVVENQEARVFVGEHRPLSLPLVEVGAPTADKAGIRTTIIFPVGAGVSVTAALSPDGQSTALKAEQCVTQLEQKGGKELLTEARGEVQCAVPLGHWMFVRVPSKSYRLTAISQKDDPASGKILMEVLREPVPDAGKAPYDIWVLLRPSLAQAADAAAGTANAEAAKAPMTQAEAAVAVARANAEVAKAMAAAAEADAVGPANELKRCRELFAAKLISQQQMDAAVTAARAADAKHVVALKEADVAKAAIVQAEAALHDANAAPGAKAGGPAEVRVFALRYAESDTVARLLAETYPDDPAKVVSDARANRLVVEASPERFKQIEELIKQFDQPANETPKPGQGVAPPPKPAARGTPATGAPGRGRP